MSNSANFFVFFILVWVKIFLVATQEDNFTFFIAGGYRPMQHTLVKYVVSIQLTRYTKHFGSNHFCGGSILTPRIILTAAHCFWDKKAEKIKNRTLQIVAKTPNRLKKTNHTEVIEVEEIIVHPNYQPEKMRNDIAIAHLMSNISEDGVYAQIIKLTTGPAEAGMKCTVVGWGALFVHGPIAANALYADLYIIERNLCQEHYKIFANGMLCAGDLEDLELHASQGDSGGPLICDGKVTGVVSFGRDSSPSVYTDVWYHRNWIYKIAKMDLNGKSAKSINILKLLLLQLIVWIIN